MEEMSLKQGTEYSGGGLKLDELEQKGYFMPRDP